MPAPFIGWFCILACTAVLAIGGHAASYDPYSTAPVTFYDVQVGVYLDDQQPNQCQDAALERTRWRLVVTGVALGGRDCPAATVNAQEWYPWGCGLGWGPIPRARAYILQWRFAWPGCHPPTARQRTRGLRAALRSHPWLIFWY